MAANNMKSMRETLETLRTRFDNDVIAYQDRYLKFSGWHWHKKAKEAAKWRDVFYELREACGAALSEPPRNCDVGTADEQAIRFDNDYCFVEVRKQTCIFSKRHDHSDCIKCFAKWAQMPYEKKKEENSNG